MEGQSRLTELGWQTSVRSRLDSDADGRSLVLLLVAERGDRRVSGEVWVPLDRARLYGMQFVRMMEQGGWVKILEMTEE